MFRKKGDDSSVATLAQSAMCCARIQDLLERSVRELQRYQASHDFPEIQSSLAHANDVCAALEAVLLHNFRAPFTAKMTSSLARLSRRQSQDQLPVTSYWPYVTLYTPRDFVEQLSRLQQISTEVGQCRAWIRLGLNHNLILSYVEAMLDDSATLRSWYSEGAFLLDESLSSLLCSLVRGLSTCDFNLDYDAAALNTWTRQVLQMIGACHSSASSGSASSPAPSENNGHANVARSQSMSTNRQKSRRVSADNNVIRELQMSPVVTCPYDASSPARSELVASLPSSFTDSPSPSVFSSPGHGATAAAAATHLPEAAGSAFPEDRHPVASMSPPRMQSLARLPSEPSEHAVAGVAPRSGPGYFVPGGGESSKGWSAGPAMSPVVVSTTAEATATSGSLSQRTSGHDDIGRDDGNGPDGAATAMAASSATSSPAFGSLPPIATTAMPTAAQTVSPARSADHQPPPPQQQRQAQLADAGKPAKKTRSLRRKKDGAAKSSKRARTQAALSEEQKRNADWMGYDVVSDDLSARQPISIDDNLDDGRMGLILKISNEQGLESQTYQCHACSRPIGVVFGPAKVCSYDGRYYCSECHLDEEELIPARLVHNWDFHKYKVCKINFEILHFMEEQPVIDLASTSPSLYTHVTELQETKLLRSQLRACYTYVSTCKDTKILEEFQKRLPREHLVQCNEHIYSVQDLVQVQSGVLVQTLKKLFVFASRHVHECQVCRMKGFICEICKDENVIFAFDVSTCTQCARCLAVFHRSCKEAVPCPKCQRLALRQQRLMSQSDGDSDS